MDSDSASRLTVRPIQYRDLDALEQLWADFLPNAGTEEESQSAQPWVQGWYWPLKLLSWFPNPWQDAVHVYVAEQERQPLGMIQIMPFNRSRTTWRVQQVVMAGGSICSGDGHSPLERSGLERSGLERSERSGGKEGTPDASGESGNGIILGQDVGSLLLRYCLEKIWEARTWIADINVNDKAHLALYRKNGFQPLANLTRWELAPNLLKTLAERELNLPNLLPVGSADARLLYQLDTVSMPPLLRQVFDRHVQDFQPHLFGRVFHQGRQWFSAQHQMSQYVFEPQRKAAIGYVKITFNKDGAYPHKAKLIVHPAYTWLYPELLTHMARLTQAFPCQSLVLKSADYQPEREAYLEQIQADRIEHTLLMSRSVWHKLREQRGVSLEGLQLSDMLQGLQPSGKTVTGGMIHQFDAEDGNQE